MVLEENKVTGEVTDAGSNFCRQQFIQCGQTPQHQQVLSSPASSAQRDALSQRGKCTRIILIALEL